MPVSDINEVVDRSLEKVLYEAVLAEGYTPDRTTYASDPAGYQTALDAIIASKGFAIAVFGAGSSQQRQLKYVPRIVYSNESFLPGTLGSDRGAFFEDNGPDFTKKVRQPLTSNLRFGIYIVSQSSKQDRVLSSILAVALPNHSYIEFYNDPTVSFYVTYGFSTTNPDVEHGLIQKKYLFEAHDLYDAEDVVVTNPSSGLGAGKIAKIIEIDVQDDDGDTLHKSQL